MSTATILSRLNRRGLLAWVCGGVVLLGAFDVVWAKGKKAGSAHSTGKSDVAVDANVDDGAQNKTDLVHISIQTVPPRKAQVRWGHKMLGTIPVPRALVVDRARDSGPLDLVIYASGFLPVHTRAYTFSDSRLSVKLTPPAEKNTLFGYREEPPPDAASVTAPTSGQTAPSPPVPASAPLFQAPAPSR